MKQKIFCLMGPTACGKTALALSVSQQLPINIISVDSAMVYRGMDIGTAKPSVHVRATIPHYLIDMCDPSEPYSAGQFCRDALTAIKQTIAQQRIPLLVGGTMLYFRALQHGLSTLPQADPVLRNNITTQAEQYGWHVLHQQLQAIDPITAARLHPNDAQRIQRALEIFYLTHQPPSAFHQQKQGYVKEHSFINIALMPCDREKLKQHIAERFKYMLSQGFLEEVQILYQRHDLQAALPALRSVGYRQAWEYFSGDITYATMVEKAIIATQQLAKRQLTWLRSMPDLTVLSMHQTDNVNAFYRLLCS